MTPQERQMIDDLFDRLARLEGAPRDPDAASAIAQGLQKAPNAVYALVQTVLVQDEALKRANARIEELQAQVGGGEQEQQHLRITTQADCLMVLWPKGRGERGGAVARAR